ncbi:MAG: prepilin peptidase [Geminicoccaceae bacterium]
MWAEAGRVVVTTGLLTLLAHAAWTDLTARRIANRTCAALALAWPVQLLLVVPPPSLTAAVLGAAAVAVPAGLLWQRGILGGGDVKLLSALALWAGPADLLPFLLLTGLAGGALAVVWLRLRQGGGLLVGAVAGRLAGTLAPATASALADPALPYGLAIAGAGAWLLVTRLTS